MSSTRTTLTALAGSLLLVGVVGGCGTSPAAQSDGGSSSQPSTQSRTTGGAAETTGSPSTSPSPSEGPVTVKANVRDGASKVEVDTRVKVSASDGTLSKVTLAYSGTDSNGRSTKGTVEGKLADDGTTWTAADRLEPSARYTLTTTASNEAQKPKTKTTTFRTQSLTLDEQTFPTLLPKKGSKVGVGMPVVLNFDVPVRDRAVVEKNLHVTSTPQQTGTWSWLSDTEVHFRPKTYWKAGTKVEVDADVNGVSAGSGIYGQQSASTSFTVGRSLITKVDLDTDVAKVYRDGKLVRTILVSGGKPGWQTRSGTKLIMAKEYNKVMTNEAIGAEEDYRLTAKYALRITNSGEFLHSAPWNTANFGRRNASHGCVGMSTADSGWLYEETLIGDPVVTTGTSRTIEQGNGYSDWDISYAAYAKRSAL